MDNAFTKSARWMFAGIIMLVLFLLLGILAVGSSISMQITQKENAKSVLHESGIYEQAIPLGVDLVLDKLTESASDGDSEVSQEELLGNITTKEELQKKLDEIFPPEWIRTQTEEAIDELYAFLAGEKDEITIEIELAEKENEMRSVLASIFKERLNTLPDCGYNSSRNIDDIDLMRAECLPDNINRAEASATIDNMVEGIHFLENKTISVNPLEDGAEAAKPARRIFFFAVSVPILLWFLVLILVSLFFALVPGEKHKMHTQGALWGFSGLMLVMAAIIAKIRFNDIALQLQSRMGADIPPELSVFIEKAAFVVYSDIINRVLIFAAMYILLAVGFVAFARWQKSSTYYKYINYAFAAFAILGIAGTAFIFLTAKENEVFVPADTENIQIQEERENKEGSRQDEEEDLHVLPEPPASGQGEHNYNNPPRGSEDNDPNAISE